MEVQANLIIEIVEVDIYNGSCHVELISVWYKGIDISDQKLCDALLKEYQDALNKEAQEEYDEAEFDHSLRVGGIL